MALEFKLKDFAHPAAIIKLRATFEKTQWFTLEEQTLYQERLLRRTVEHAYRRVPYYRELFDRIRLKPDDIRRLPDLDKIPILTKEILSAQFKTLEATNSHAFRPQAMCTSGTTGRRLQFLVDRPSNVLEFVYYWRHWNSAGYKLGAPFAEFSSVFFLRGDEKSRLASHHQRLPNRLLLNSLSMSHATVRDYVRAIRKHRPLFLKGLPSVLYHFSLFLRQQGIADISFKAVFSTGETLVPRFRKLIEATLGCKVYDSYGHMERTVAISECPLGGLHINPDYGILELIRHDSLRADLTGEGGCDNSSSRANYSASVIGTSLYNFSMPLLRYEVGDIVSVEPEKKCACGRQFPLVSAIEGRQSEVLLTPEGKVITGAFLVFEDVPDILEGQIIQESLERLHVRIVPAPPFSKAGEARLKSRLQMLVGSAVKISLERCESAELLRAESGKLLTVVSNRAAGQAISAPE
jgi:phenylacetate-CoA ligase